MIATYRLQLTPEFGFAAVRRHLPYFRRLGVSHLYLSPIAEAAAGSMHGYDVTDHNTVRRELGGREEFEELRKAALEHDLNLLLDIVPNHAGVGPYNEEWQDVLAYGAASPHASTFDIDWEPPKRELRGKLLLPFLGKPYGEALDDGEIKLVWDDGYFYATYFDSRFRLAPATYDEILDELLVPLERHDEYFDLLELRSLYGELGENERGKAEALRPRLARILGPADLQPALTQIAGSRLHALLERQNWRLAYWKTAGDEINYRRFFDVNGLAALRMEEPSVFFDSHRLLGELLLEEGVDGVRVDHVDGLTDPHGYLRSLSELGARRVWVEKILAPGETLPQDWPVCGTTGYEFMNDVVRLLVYPDGEQPLLAAYRRFVGDFLPWHEEAVRSKRLVMETSLAGELAGLTGLLHRLSEADYHYRDFTAHALRDALADIIACFERYRTYLPFERDEAQQVLRRAVSEAKRRAENTETTVHEFVFRCLIEEFPEPLEPVRERFAGRFQQYSAPVAAKGVEDTAFYRFVPLAALNEVGGDPDHFTVELQAFHSRARFRQHRYPLNLLATSTHDHKRGEDTRMRMAVLSEIVDEWQELLARLEELSQRYWLERNPLGAPRISPRDSYLLYQHLTALSSDEAPDRLAERLQQYMLKAVREAKQESSWIDPDEAYEEAVASFVAWLASDAEVMEAVAPVAGVLRRHGFRNGLGQLVLKLTTPGVPDFYQGSELLDLSLVDPDNRRNVDFEQRLRLLDELDAMGAPEETRLRTWLEAGDERLKLLLTSRLLALRKDLPSVFEGGYRPLDEMSSEADERWRHFIGFIRESDSAQLLVLVPRWLAVLERGERSARRQGWQGLKLPLPGDLAAGEWREVLTGRHLNGAGGLDLSSLPLLPAVLLREGRFASRRAGREADE